MIKTRKFQLELPVHGVTLSGEMNLPEQATGFVIFSHGSGSSRFSVRNNFVARILNERSIGTLLFDLLTEEEDSLYANRFDIEVLSERLIAVTKFMKQKHLIAKLPFGYFGASTGAASALNAAVSLPKIIEAVVSRGGRPDLAMEKIPEVIAPTLLIVGERDTEVLELNCEVYDKLTCEKKLEVVKGATHLFEEEGTLTEAAELAADWFEKFLVNKKVILK
ncbi:MAG TPA: alpha/beta hydrolase [Bacteroidia bacterium]|nr:alpha/beta hydrolase [Bacteroidia bacterium]